jgi:hypothetical protein
MANASARVGITANPRFPNCLADSYRRYLRHRLASSAKKFPGMSLGPVDVQVTANPASSDVHSSTVTTGLTLLGRGGAPLLNVVFNDLVLQKGPVISVIAMEATADPRGGPGSSPAALLQRLDDTLTTRISEHVPEAQGTSTQGGAELNVQGAPDDPLDYAVNDPTCSVERSGTEVVGRGTFAGAKGDPLPTLPLDETYNINISVFSADGGVLGVFVSNEQSDYMNAGRSWSVVGTLPPGSRPSWCWYEIGTYDLQHLAPIVTPPTPASPDLN